MGSLQSLLKSNFTPIAQAVALIAMLFAGWVDSTDIVIIYATETILIGVFHIFKMLIISFYGKMEVGQWVKGVGLTLFFSVHYGFFAFIQTTFFFVFLSMTDDRISDSFGSANFITALHLPGVQAASIVLILSLVLKLFRNFLAPKKYVKIDITEFMFVPYLRIVVQQFVAILPGFFIIFFDGGYVTAIILILMRTTFDILLNRLKNQPDFLDKAAIYLARPKGNETPKATPEEIRHFLQMVIDE